MGRVHFSALGLGFQSQDLTLVWSRVNGFWFEFIKFGSSSGLVVSSFLHSILTEFGHVCGKIFFGLFGFIKKLLGLAKMTSVTVGF